MKRLTLLLIMLLGTAVLAQDLPRIAVYVTGNFPDDEKKALGTRMLATLINSGRYEGIERTGTFLAEIDKEQVKQRSGAIDDGQIRELGKQFGVQYICIADITPVLGSYQVSARIVDVETAKIVAIGDYYSNLKSAVELVQTANEVVKKMFGWQTAIKPEPRYEPRPRIEPRPEPKPEPKPEPEPKIEPKAEAKSEPEPQPTPEPRPEPKVEVRLEPEPQVEPQPAPGPEPEPKVEVRLEPKPEPKPVPAPQPEARQTVLIPKQPAPAPAPQQPITPPKPPEPSLKTSFWIGIGLDMVGAGLVVYGLVENGNANEHIDNYRYSKAESSMTNRNIAYTIGAAVLLSGISIHIFF